MAEVTTPSQKKILILGGSYGGTSIAHYTLKHTIPNLPEKETYQVVLVSTSAEAICRPACPRALISDKYFDQSRLFVDVAKQYEQYPSGSFKFIKGSATSWDHEKRTVTITVATGGTEEIEYYALVIATGCTTSSPLHGFNHGDSEALKNTWKSFREALPSAKSIVIAGGGPTGVETAAELGEHLNERAGFFSSKLANPKVPITIVTAASQILPYMKEPLANKAEGLLAKVGVTVVKNTRVTSVEPTDSGTASNLTAKTKIILEGGKEMEADLYIPAFGFSPNTEFVTDKSLLDGNGRVEVVLSSLRVEKAGERVYAIGDCCNAARPAIHLMKEASPVLGSNLKRDLLLAAGKTEADAGVPKEKTYIEDKKETHIVPIGKSVTSGVGVAMGWSVFSVFVWLLKGRDYWLWTTGTLWNGKDWSKEA